MPPLIAKRAVLHFKAEAVPGTAETAGLVAIDAMDLKVKPSVGISWVPGMSGFGATAAVATARSADVSFKFRASHKAAAEPRWMSLLPGCGFVLAGGIYSPTSKPPGAAGGASSLTFRYNQDGRQQVVVGAMGSLTIEAESAGEVMCTATFKGVLLDPTDTAMAAANIPTDEVIGRLSSSGLLTIGGNALDTQKISISLGGDVQLVPSNLTDSGYSHAVVGDMQVKGSLVMKALTNATYRPLLKHIANASEELIWRVGAAGNGFTINIPKLRYEDEDEQVISGVRFDVATFGALRASGDGDNQITFDPTA